MREYWSRSIRDIEEARWCLYTFPSESGAEIDVAVEALITRSRRGLPKGK